MRPATLPRNPLPDVHCRRLQPKPTNMKIITAQEHQATDESGVLALANDVDPRSLDLSGVSRIDLQFPKFTDGRAYSQAFLLRRRLAFKGEIRATGDVLVDQLVQMQRSGFDSAVLRTDQNLDVGLAQFGHFDAYYQGDAVTLRPAFSRGA